MENEKGKFHKQLNEKYFIKNISGFKKMTDIVSFKNIPQNKNVLVSELINIISEWRGIALMHIQLMLQY